MSMLAAAAVGAGIGAAGNLLGSASQSALGYAFSKRMAKYNYDLQKKGYQEFPTAQVEGLRAAGINPMVAYGGIAGAQAHAQNYQAAPGSDLGSSAVGNYRENKKLDPTVENIQADTKAKYAQAEAAEAQAGAASNQGKASLLNSMTNARKVNAEVKLIEQQRQKLETNTPGQSTWGTVDRVLDNTGSAGTALGGSAIAAKGVYDMVKSKDAGKAVSNTVGKSAAQYIKPTSTSKAVSTAKTASKLLPALVIGSKALGPIALGVGSLYGAKKLNDVYDKSKNAKKIKEHNTYQHGNWSR